MFYKIIRGYDAENYIPIDASEVQKAYYCFLQKKDSIFSGGAIKGSEIVMISPDFHRIMGWNRGYKLGVDDFEELAQKNIDKKCQSFLSMTKEAVQYLIETKQENLIGKYVLPERKTNQGIEGMRKIGDMVEVNNPIERK